MNAVELHSRETTVREAARHGATPHQARAHLRAGDLIAGLRAVPAGHRARPLGMWDGWRFFRLGLSSDALGLGIFH
jgi:hypothetical protein